MAITNPQNLGDGKHHSSELEHLAAQRDCPEEHVLRAEDEQRKIVQDIPDTGGDDDDRDRFADVFFPI